MNILLTSIFAIITVIFIIIFIIEFKKIDKYENDKDISYIDRRKILNKLIISGLLTIISMTGVAVFGFTFVSM